MSRMEQLAILARALGTKGRRRLAVLALLTLVGGVAEFASVIALLKLLRSWLEPGSGWSAEAAAAFALAVITAGGLRLALLTLTQRLGLDTGHQLLVAVQRRVLARDWVDHSAARASGPLAAAEHVDLVIHGVLLPLLRGGTAIILGGAILAALVRIDAVAALAAAVLLGLLFLITTALYRPVLRRAGKEIERGHDARIAAIQDNVGALRELILAGARGVAAERFRRIDRSLASARADSAVATGSPRILVESIGLLALVGLAWWLSARSGGLSEALPALGALALGAQRLLPLAQTLSQAAAGFTANAPALERLAAVLDAPDLDEEVPPSPLPFTRELRLEQVSFTYPERDGPAVEGIDLCIRRSERVALCGPNGSGKSTLADLVMGLLAPEQGRIVVDGKTIGPADIRAWQRNIAHVPQTPFLADASIAENIAFMADRSDHPRLVEAARLAGLHPFIASLPRGYETRIGERGLLLSGGQRQRLALARALYAPAPLLILDEATSAIDPETETHILGALRALSERGTTILLIAHRSSMVEGCDQIIGLDEGRIASR